MIHILKLLCKLGVGIVAFFFLGICISSFVGINDARGRQSDTAYAYAAPAPTPTVNSNDMVIGSHGDSNDWLCPSSEDDFNAMMDAVSTGNDNAYRRSVYTAVRLHRGDHVRIIGRSGPFMTTVHLLVLTGASTTSECFMASDTPGFIAAQ